MTKEYISRDAAQDAMTADNLLAHFDSLEDTIEYRFHRAAERVLEELPAADVVGVPEWMTKDELLDILKAAREGRLKITAPPIETTCGSCRHFQPNPGMASGKCDCRMKRNRRGDPTGQVLYVTQSHKACRDDYERRQDE